MTAPTAHAHAPIERWLWLLACAAGAVAIAGFAWAALQRVPYPHELEWMEGALADHAARLVDGLPIYCEPTPEHVPFLYAPLLFWLGGLGMSCGLDGVLALRLVACGCTIACAMLIGHWVRVETRRLLPGLAASGLFVAGYGWLAWWYDLARNDSLFVFGCLATAYQLRHGGARRWLWAALLATATLLAKQSALLWLPAVGVGTLVLDWRIGLRFGLACVVAMGAAVGVLHLASDGWSTFYLFEMPRHHGVEASKFVGYWTEDFPPMLPATVLGVLACVLRRHEPRHALFLAAFGAGGLLASWFSRMHAGGFDNVLMYGFAGACVLGPIGATGLGRFGPLLLLAQFAWLGQQAWSRGSATLLPSAAHRQAHDELAAFVRAQPGPVWLPGHGAITRRAGKGTGAHGMAIFDLLQVLPDLDVRILHDPRRLAALPGRGGDAVRALVANAAAALQRQHFAALVIDEIGAGQFPFVFAQGLLGGDGALGTADDTYVRAPGPVVRDGPALRPPIGYDVHSPYVLLPRR